MRFYLIPVFFVIFGLNFVNAQRFGYIDTDFILNKMPDYGKAQEEINRLSGLWEKEILEMARGIEAQYSSLQAEQVLLTDAMKKERLDAIKKKEADLKEYQKKVFGFEGLLFLK
ncbi:MAG TPA: OmpH family outer membrane protein, partial [Cyclobacteriaceae bacterium]|nr:OmpH family outer membrane protein [Cyclobacteriaceae bacterium]